jgi:hypothetical protein
VECLQVDRRWNLEVIDPAFAPDLPLLDPTTQDRYHHILSPEDADLAHAILKGHADLRVRHDGVMGVETDLELALVDDALTKILLLFSPDLRSVCTPRIELVRPVHVAVSECALALKNERVHHRSDAHGPGDLALLVEQFRPLPVGRDRVENLDVGRPESWVGVISLLVEAKVDAVGIGPEDARVFGEARHRLTGEAVVLIYVAPGRIKYVAHLISCL